MRRILSFLAIALLLSTSAVRAASPLAGNASGRALLSGDDTGSFYGVAQQTISGFSIITGRVVSDIVVVSSPVALEISDRIDISLGRVRYRTNFTLAGCNCSFTTLTGRAHVAKKTIVYSAKSSDGTLKINGVIRRRGNAVVRTETRNESGSIYAIQVTTYP
jgi:hypothetical protein